MYNQSISTTGKDGHTHTQEIRHSQTNELHQEVLRWHGQGKANQSQNNYHPNHNQGHHTAFDYDSIGRLIKQEHLKNVENTETFKVYHYHNNHLGTPQELTDECGNVV